jgi:hypothetical protein
LFVLSQTNYNNLNERAINFPVICSIIAGMA